ncbi:MAG TPA: MauE/DoxX family redox-associated membrane protein, partial [Candidatus Dormibacteraeota bacterium]|nr:MauE/DoxX family redox-associated membrane protein [Candidatus Dormibacteraeota bacterium]
MEAAVLVIRVLLGALLMVAGALKVAHPASLAQAIAGFRLLPAAIVGPLALALPWLELLLGGYLIAGLFTR